jgi:hypothetical protein
MKTICLQFSVSPIRPVATSGAIFLSPHSKKPRICSTDTKMINIKLESDQGNWNFQNLSVHGWVGGWLGGWVGGWVGGWMDGSKSRFKDCLQQSKIGASLNFKIEL